MNCKHTLANTDSETLFSALFAICHHYPSSPPNSSQSVHILGDGIVSKQSKTPNLILNRLEMNRRSACKISLQMNSVQFTAM